jgi:predicted small metal-binding protein
MKKHGFINQRRMNKMKLFECEIELGSVYPVREAETKEEFIKNLIEEYNEKCFDLFEINEDMIKEVEEV